MTFAAQTVAFLLGNDFLEHHENLLGTMRSHLNRLRLGGIAGRYGANR